MPTLNKDWLLTPDGYNNNGNTLLVDTGIAIGLNTLQSSALSIPYDTGFPEASSNWLHLRTLGELHLWWNPAEADSSTWFNIADVAIITCKLDPITSAPLVPVLGYDLTSASEINALDILWRDSEVGFNIASWTEPVYRDRNHIKLNVDAKARRRIAEDEGICLLIQWTNDGGAPGVGPRLNYWPRLRTLGQMVM